MDRDTNPVQLTPAGIRVLEFAQNTLREWESLKQSLSHAARPAGSLEIGSSTVPAKILVLPAVAGFLRGYPAILVHAAIMNSQKVLQAIERESVDLGFVGMAPSFASWDTQIIGRDEVVLVVPNQSEYQVWPRGIPVKMVEQLPFVQRKDGSGTQFTAYSALKERGVQSALRVVCEVDSHEDLIDTVATGIGVGFASRQVVKMMDRTDVKIMTVEGGPILRNLYRVSKYPIREHTPAELFLRYTLAHGLLSSDFPNA